MSDPTRRNRLDNAASPYLRQHADNPVAWQPWDEQALAAAEQRDVPIFLSIGYAACHWCHVMEEESFQDEAVAAILNEEYIPIKVDREERPEVDAVYMKACQLVRGSGGWPLSAWLTPSGDPFYVATYLPRDPEGGHPGFLQVLEDIASGWTDSERRSDFESRADQLATAITQEMESVPDTAQETDESIVLHAARSAIESADRTHGGFGSSPKFPHPGRIRLLFRAADRLDDAEAIEVGTAALDAMASGGLYDHLGGGFHRYCTDADWTVPHYEKMLYDNAELPRAYLVGYRVTGDERYADVVRDTLAFVDRELGQSDGGFYSTLSARSGAGEGAYYTWTPDELQSALAAADVSQPELVAELARDHWGITTDGNTEDNRTVLTIQSPISDLADTHDLAPSTVDSHLNTAQDALLAERTTREQPPRDEKILAGWNGLAITAFADAGLTLDDRFTDRATTALNFIRDTHWTGDQLYHRDHHGTVGIPGYLEDYAFVGHAALTCYEVTGNQDHLTFALDLGRSLVDRFWDPDAATLYFTDDTTDAPVARPQELQDQSTPSSTGVAIELLTKLAAITPNDEFEPVAQAVLETHGSTLNQHPLQHISLITAADTVHRGNLEVTTVGDIPPDWRSTIGDTHLPDRLLTPRPADDETLHNWLTDLDIESIPPIWANRSQVDDQPTAYVCRQACSPPIHTTENLREWLAEYS